MPDREITGQTGKAGEFIRRVMNWERDYDPEDRQVASRYCTFIREYNAALRAARDEGLEQAAKVCDGRATMAIRRGEKGANWHCRESAAAIRSLKSKGGE